MAKQYVKYVLMMTLIAVIGISTGCRKNKAGQDGDNLNLNGLDGIGSVDGIDGIPLGGRPDGVSGFRGQFEPVFFAYDSAQIQASERFKLETVATYLKQNPSVSLIVEGHTDERGSREYNLALGERRALAARAYLVGLGISANRLQTSSYGEEQPADIGGSDASHSLNRRSEFVVLQ